MNKKGFTLIELLAVIVILAVIAIVVTPLITSTIENSKRESRAASARNYASAVEQEVARSQLTNTPIKDGTYPVSNFNGLVKGTLPTSGTVTIVKGLIDSYSLAFDDYTVTKKSGSDDLTIVPTNSGSVVVKSIGTMTDNLIKAAGTNTYTYLGGTYLKGAQSNNYVWFNGFVWRIMGKDAAGNIKMITEENVTAIPWGASDSAQNYSSSYANSWVSSYFYSHIKNTNQGIIKPTVYCKDAATTSSTSARIDCTGGTQANAQAAMLSIDEYNLAGGASSYLVNGQAYWALTPCNSSNAWFVKGDGMINGDVLSYAYGLRSVITISSDATITGGDGTLSQTSNGYILNQTLDDAANKKVSEVVTSGEYVKYDGRTYRVVEKNTDGIKLILDGFYPTATICGSNFSTMSSTLNSSTFQSWLLPTKTPQPVKWYRGANFVYGNDYANNLASTNNEFQITGTKSIGLIKVGEMLSGQSLSMLTNGYDTTVATTSRNDNTKWYWTLTPYDSSGTWFIGAAGAADNFGPLDVGQIRPVIVISSDAIITKGNGTLTSQYEVN